MRPWIKPWLLILLTITKSDAVGGRHSPTSQQVLVCQQGACQKVLVSRISSIDLQSPNLRIYVRDRSGHLKRLPQFTVRSIHSGHIVKRCRFSYLRGRYYCRGFPNRKAKNCYSTRVVRTSCYRRFKCKKYIVVKRMCPVEGKFRLKCPNNGTIGRLEYYRTKCMRLVYKCSYSESTKCKHFRHKCRKIANLSENCPKYTNKNKKIIRGRHRKYRPCASNYNRCRSRGHGLKTCLGQYSSCSKLLRCSNRYSRCVRRRNRHFCWVRHRSCREEVNLGRLPVNRYLVGRKSKRLCGKLYGICCRNSNRSVCRKHYLNCLQKARTNLRSKARLGRNISESRCKSLQKYIVKCRIVIMTCTKDRPCKKSLLYLCQRVLKIVQHCHEIQKEKKCHHFALFQSRCLRVLQMCKGPGRLCSSRYVNLCQKLIRVVHQCQRKLAVSTPYHHRHHHDHHHDHHNHHHHHHHNHHNHHHHHHHNHLHNHLHNYYSRHHHHHLHPHHQFMTERRLFSVCKKVIVYRRKCANLIKFCESDFHSDPRICGARYVTVCKKALAVMETCTVASTRNFKYNQHHQKHQIQRKRTCRKLTWYRGRCHRYIRYCSKRHRHFGNRQKCSRKHLGRCYKVLRLANSKVCRRNKFGSTHRHDQHKSRQNYRRVLYPKCSRRGQSTHCSSTKRYSDQCESRIRHCDDKGISKIRQCLGVYAEICLKLIKYQRHCCRTRRTNQPKSSQFRRKHINKARFSQAQRISNKDRPKIINDKMKKETSGKPSNQEEAVKKFWTQAKLDQKLKVNHGRSSKGKARIQMVQSQPKFDTNFLYRTNQLSNSKAASKSKYKEYFRQYQTCTKNIRIQCKDKKCKNKQTVLLLQSVCYFQFYSKVLCSKIERARTKCGESSSPTCKRLRSAQSRHCSNKVGESPCRKAKKTLTSCYQLHISRCRIKNKYNCHIGAVRLCKLSLKYQRDLDRCKKWSRKARIKRCHTLVKSLEFCHRVRCHNFKGNNSFCQLKKLKCNYIVKLHASSCKNHDKRVKNQQGPSVLDQSRNQSSKNLNTPFSRELVDSNLNTRLVENKRLKGTIVIDKRTKEQRKHIDKVKNKGMKTGRIAAHDNKPTVNSRGQEATNGSSKGIARLEPGAEKKQFAEKPIAVDVVKSEAEKEQLSEKPNVVKTRNKLQVKVHKKETEKVTKSSESEEKLKIKHGATKQRIDHRSIKSHKSDIKRTNVDVENPKAKRLATKKNEDHNIDNMSIKRESEKKKLAVIDRETTGQTKDINEKPLKLNQPSHKGVVRKENDKISGEDGKIANDYEEAEEMQSSSTRQQIKNGSNDRLSSESDTDTDTDNDQSFGGANRDTDGDYKEKKGGQKPFIDRKIRRQRKGGSIKAHKLTDKSTVDEHEKLDLNGKSKKTGPEKKTYLWGPGRPIQYPKSMSNNNEHSNHAKREQKEKSNSENTEGGLLPERHSSSTSGLKHSSSTSGLEDRSRRRVVVHSAGGSSVTLHKADLKRNKREDNHGENDVDSVYKKSADIIPTSDEEDEEGGGDHDEGVENQKGGLKRQTETKDTRGRTNPFTASGLFKTLFSKIWRGKKTEGK